MTGLPGVRIGRETGLALVLVLAMLAVLVVLVLEAATEARVNLRRVENSAESARLGYLAQGGIEAAKLLIAHDAVTSSIDHLGETWAAPMGPYRVGQDKVSVRVTAADGKLNLNHLVGPDGQADLQYAVILRRLYATLGLDPQLVDSLQDWLDVDSVAAGDLGAESAYYERLSPPYRCKNGPLDSLGELRAVRGYDAAMVERLTPYVSALPSDMVNGALLNVNTAPPEVLLALDPQFTPDTVDAIVTARPFATVEQVTALAEVRGEPEAVRWLSTRSRYFLVTAEARGGQALVRQQALIDRGTGRDMRVLRMGDGSA